MNQKKAFLFSLLAITLVAGCATNRDKVVFQHIDQILTSPVASSNQWAVLVTDRKGRVCYEKNAAKAAVPASNMKLFTVSAAFGLLGTNHSFETRIYFDGPLTDGVLKGDVNLCCEHDITWTPDVFPNNGDAPLEYMAAQLKKQGLKSVLGKVQCYGACFYNPQGRTANSDWHDPGYQADYNKDAADGFKKALLKSGILLSTNAPVGKTGFTAPGELAYTYHSTDLSNGEPLDLQRAIIPLLKNSDNVAADALMRHIGYKMAKEDSYAAGAEHVLAWLQNTAEISTNLMVIEDGSGLSRDDHVTPQQCVAVLRYMLANYSGFARGLPISCTDGTLRHRMCDPQAKGKVHAKTGTLRITGSLSGYVEGKDGAPKYFFSFIANNPHRIDIEAARQTIDEAVTQLTLSP